MLGIAIRIAQRMGIDKETILAKVTPLEAELRRRLCEYQKILRSVLRQGRYPKRFISCAKSAS